MRLEERAMRNAAGNVPLLGEPTARDCVLWERKPVFLAAHAQDAASIMWSRSGT